MINNMSQLLTEMKYAFEGSYLTHSLLQSCDLRIQFFLNVFICYAKRRVESALAYMLFEYLVCVKSNSH
jgi:hypothetical protein